MNNATRLTSEQRQLVRENPHALLRQMGLKPVKPPKQQGKTKVTYRP